MTAKTKKAAAATVASKRNETPTESYQPRHAPSTGIRRLERIRKYRADIPKIHRRVYDRAIQGKSLKSAVKMFCLECVSWQKEEVRYCTSFACPLYPYRPYKQRSKQASQGPGFGAEATNSEKGGNNGL